MVYSFIRCVVVYDISITKFIISLITLMLFIIFSILKIATMNSPVSVSVFMCINGSVKILGSEITGSKGVESYFKSIYNTNIKHEILVQEFSNMATC